MGGRWSVLVGVLAAGLAGCGGGPTDVAPPSSSAPAVPGGVEVAQPVGLAWAGGSVWAASAGGGEVVRIDPGSATITARVPVSGTPLRVAADEKMVWVSAFRSGHVLAIDLASSQVVHDVTVGDGPEGIAVGLGAVWVVRQNGRQLTRLDANGTVLGSTALDAEPRLVAIGATHVWVSNFGTGTLTRVEASGQNPRTSAKICDGAQGLAIAAGIVWVTCTTAGEVVAVDEATMAVRGRVPVPGEPDGIRVSGRDVWVVSTAGPTLVRISATPDSPTVLASERLGDAPALADQANDDLIPAGDVLAVSSYRTGRVHLSKPIG